ncbi:hypothetical protein TNCV_1551511 [Trichonephila clavipes]|nr:hypothetical protein TNCV_1551511 [Trichonephila clavipes]
MDFGAEGNPCWDYMNQRFTPHLGSSILIFDRKHVAWSDESRSQLNRADGRVRLGEGVPAQVSSTSLDHGSKLRGPSPKSPRVAEQCDVNIQSINQRERENAHGDKIVPTLKSPYNTEISGEKTDPPNRTKDVEGTDKGNLMTHTPGSVDTEKEGQTF